MDGKIKKLLFNTTAEYKDVFIYEGLKVSFETADQTTPS